MLFIFNNFYSVKEDIEHNYFHHYKMFKYPAGLFVMQVLLLKWNMWNGDDDGDNHDYVGSHVHDVTECGCF